MQYVIKEYEITSNIIPFLLEGTTSCGKYVYARERWGTLRIEIDGEVVYRRSGLYDFSGYDDLKRYTQDLFLWPN